jgi:O-antigen ligase
MVKISYVVSFALLFVLTLASMSGFLVGKLCGFIGVPEGYISFFLMALAVPFLCIIVLKRKHKVVRPLWAVAKFWLPWVIYLCLSGSSSAEGVWKLKMYLGKMVLPSMCLVGMALCNPSLFEKYFMRVLLWLNIVTIVVYSLKLVEFRFMQEAGAEGIERMIWLSRGIGINIAYLVLTSAWKKRPLLTIPLIIVLFGVMLFIGSRGPVLSLVLVLGLFWLIKNRKSVATVVLSGVATGLLVIAFLNVGYLTDFAKAFSTHGTKQEVSHVAQDRMSAYLPSLEIFAEHPLTGAGLGQYWSAYQKNYRAPEWMINQSILLRARGKLDVQYPHNIVCEILAELGLIGTALFLLLFFPFKRLFVLSNKYNLLCLLGFLYACTSSDITQNSAPMIFNLLSILCAQGVLSAADIKQSRQKRYFVGQMQAGGNI